MRTQDFVPCSVNVRQALPAIHGGKRRSGDRIRFSRADHNEFWDIVSCDWVAEGGRDLSDARLGVH